MGVTVEITVAVGLGCSLIGAALGVAGYKRKAEKESEADGKDKGVMLTELGYIKAGIDDIKQEQRNQSDRHHTLAERVTRVEESTKQAHLRINRLEKEGE